MKTPPKKKLKGSKLVPGQPMPWSVGADGVARAGGSTIVITGVTGPKGVANDSVAAGVTAGVTGVVVPFSRLGGSEETTTLGVTGATGPRFIPISYWPPSRFLASPLRPASRLRLKLASIYSAGLLALLGSYLSGFLSPVLARGGWVSGAVALLAAAHALGSLATASCPTEARASWLEKADASILAIGFLGKLYGIAVVTASVSSGGSAQEAMAGLSRISQGVSAALYSTMLGLGFSLWTHCASLVYSNSVDDEDFRRARVEANMDRIHGKLGQGFE